MEQKYFDETMNALDPRLKKIPLPCGYCGQSVRPLTGNVLVFTINGESVRVHKRHQIAYINIMARRAIERRAERAKVSPISKGTKGGNIIPFPTSR